jgi:hypothetical protein
MHPRSAGNEMDDSTGLRHRERSGTILLGNNQNSTRQDTIQFVEWCSTKRTGMPSASASQSNRRSGRALRFNLMMWKDARRR